MARLAILFSVVFVILTVSHAGFIVPEDTVTAEETVTDLPDSDSTTTTAIRLPSEELGSEPAKIVDFKHDDVSETDSDAESVPLTMISFRPVNRHFPRRPLFPFRHKHNCRFHKRFRPLNPRFRQKRYVSYGDDMIVSDERTRFYPESRDLGPQIPARWARFFHNGVESKAHVDFRMPHPYDHEHDHEQEHDHEEEHDHEHVDHEHDHDHDDNHHHQYHHHQEEEERRNESEEHEGGFMNRFRKFLINFS